MRRNPFIAGVCLVAVMFMGTRSTHAQSHLERLGDTQAEGAQHIATASIDDERFVTAFEDNAGDMKLIVWRATADGNIQSQGNATAGKTATFAMAAVGNNLVVTAVRQQNGHLRLISWVIDGNGNIIRTAQQDAGPVDSVSIAAAGPGRVVTATQSGGATKLITWSVDPLGQLNRLADSGDKAPGGTKVAVAAFSATQVACAVQSSSGDLIVTSWALDITGKLSLADSKTGPAINELTLTNTALDRAVTAVRLSDGTVQVQAWDFDLTTGAINPASSDHAGSADHLSLAALNGAKVIVGLRESNGDLKLICWQVIDQVKRMDDATAGAVSDISMVGLGWDHMISAVRSGTNLKLIDWVDRSVALLTSEWNLPSKASAPKAPEPIDEAEEIENDPDVVLQGSQLSHFPDVAGVEKDRRGATPGPPPPPPGPSSASSIMTFLPDIGGVDPMIAVSENYIIVSEQGKLEFFSKNGNNPPNVIMLGSKQTMTSSQFFNGLFTLKNSNGSINRNDINLYQRLPFSSDNTLLCNPATLSGKPCVNSFYDTRVAYDPYAKRFLIMAAARGNTRMTDNTMSVANRFFAIALSKTENPADGFFQYMDTESNYSDWPRAGINDGVLVIAHNSCKQPDDVDPCKILAKGASVTVPRNFGALRPTAYVFNLKEMESGGPTPPNWKLYPFQTGAGSVFPVVHHASSDGWTFMVHSGSSGAEFFGFKQTSQWGKIPEIKHSNTLPGSVVSGFKESFHFQNNQVFFGGAIQVAPRVPNNIPAQYRVRGIAIPLSAAGDNLSAGPCDDDCEVFSLGLEDSAPGAIQGYEMSSLAPNAAGDLFMAFGRIPIMMKTPTGQEARFTIFFHDSRGLQASQPIHTGDVVLKDVDCPNGENTATVEDYWHVWYKTGTCPQQKNFLDYATAVSDPDGVSFWFAHAFATKGGFKFVAGKVTPAPAPPPLPPKGNTGAGKEPCVCADGFKAGPDAYAGTTACQHICMGHEPH